MGILKTFVVRIIGFSAPERQMLNTIFRLTAIDTRRVAYVVADHVSMEEPDLLLLDGDSDTAVASWKTDYPEQQHRTVIVGVRNGNLGCQPASKPLGLKVVSALDKLATPMFETGQAPAAPALRPKVEVAPVAAPPVAAQPVVAPPEAAPPAAAQVEEIRAPAAVIPVAPAATPAAPAPVVSAPAAPPPAPATPAAPAFKVLAVDDSPLMRNFLQSRLQPYGIEPEFAITGEEALFKISNQKYDLVFLDVMLPGMDGYDVCKAVKKNKERTKTHVVMLTSRDKTFDKIRGTMAGCDGYLTKPVDETRLRAILERFPVAAR